MLGIQKSLDLAASSEGMKGLYRVLLCLCYIGFYRGYVGIVEKKMETTIMGYLGICIYTERVWGSDLLFIVDTENPAWM